MWSNQYLNIPWKWGGDTKTNCDCLGLVKMVLHEQLDMDLPEQSPSLVDANYDMIQNAVKHGTIIDEIKDLKEFDVVFFKIKGEVRHMGIMVDKFGKFLHQIENKPSRVSKLNSLFWKRKFYCGVRANGR